MLTDVLPNGNPLHLYIGNFHITNAGPEILL